MKKIVIETENFLLQTLTEKDASEKYLSWLRDREITKFLYVSDKEQNIQTIKEYISSHNNKTHFLFGILSRSEEKHIGNFSLRFHPKDKRANLGVLIGDKKFWGKSVPLECRAKILDWVFINFDCKKVEGGCIANNYPAVFNYQKQNWKVEGILKSHRYIDNRACDEIMFAMFREDWFEQRDS